MHDTKEVIIKMFFTVLFWPIAAEAETLPRQYKAFIFPLYSEPWKHEQLPRSETGLTTEPSCHSGWNEPQITSSSYRNLFFRTYGWELQGSQGFYFSFPSFDYLPDFYWPSSGITYGNSSLLKPVFF